MQSLKSVLLAGAALFTAALAPGAAPRLSRDSVTPPIIAANDNRAAAGTQRHGVLTVRMVARKGSWSPDEGQNPPMVVYAFGEEGHSPSIPGPLIRVTQGTLVHMLLRNALDSAIYVHGLQSRPAAALDTLRVAAGETREITFDPGAPGTYLYWASSDSAGKAMDDRFDKDTQLNGVIVVDAPGPHPADRILVITGADLPPDSTGPAHTPERFMAAMNGRIWPRTERFTYVQGDSIHWRWVNASFEPHPMHLHGFFFRIRSSGSMLADTVLPPDWSRLAVTEALSIGETREIVWVPERAGNWIMHCHILAHVTPESFTVVPREHAAGNHAMTGMMGLAVGVQVLPRGRVMEAAEVQRRPIRMVVGRLAGAGRSRIGMAISDASAGEAGTLSSPGAPLMLRVGEPARITIVNRLDQPTSIHWHGLELDSYFDGVADWSGAGTKLAPLIAPGDSFAADITPVRAGTYIYHTHLEDTHQRGDGGYGALIVLDSAGQWDPGRDLLFILGGREIEDTLPPMLNGSPTPPPMDLVAGTPYRLHLISIMENNAPYMRIVRGDTLVRWHALARDAVPLPAGLAVTGPSVTRAVVGSTFDFEFTPSPGEYQFQIRRGGSGVITNRQLLRVRARN